MQPIYSLTIETLTDVMGGGDVTKQRLEQLDFRSERYKLETLENISFIGDADESARDVVTDFFLHDNLLKSIVEIARDNGVDAFRRAANVFAPNNQIKYMCYTPEMPYCNEWPYKMESLLELDLSYNQLEAIPELKSMPHLRKLNLNHNSIRPPWKQLRAGKELQILELRENKLDWTPSECKVLSWRRVEGCEEIVWGRTCRCLRVGEESGWRNPDGSIQTEAPRRRHPPLHSLLHSPLQPMGGTRFCVEPYLSGGGLALFLVQGVLLRHPRYDSIIPCVVGNMRVAVRRLPSKQRSSVRRPAHSRLSPTQFYACPQWPHTSPQTCTRLPAHGLLPHAPEGRESQPYSSVSLVLRSLHPLTPHSRSSAISSVLFPLSSPFFSSFFFSSFSPLSFSHILRSVCQDVKELSNLTKLRIIHLKDNPFVKDLKDYYLHVVKVVCGAQRGNKYKISSFRLEMVDEYSITKAVQDRAQLVEEPTQVTVRDRSQVDAKISRDEDVETKTLESAEMPTMETIIQIVEECFAEPTASVKKVNQLNRDVRDIAANRDEHAFLFSGSISKEDSIDKTRREEAQKLVVEEFLQNMVLLMQRQPQLQPSLLRCLANLASVTVGKIGLQCMEVLQDTIMAGEDCKAMVVDVINDCVIPQLRKASGNTKKDKEVRASIISGLTHLAESSGLGESLADLTDTLIKWMKDEDPSEQIIAMCAVASKFPKNAMLMGQANLVTEIMRELDNAGTSSAKYYKLLHTADNLARFHVDEGERRADGSSTKMHSSAGRFVQGTLHRILLQLLRDILSQKQAWNKELNERAAVVISCIEGMSLCKNGLQDLLNPSKQLLRLLKEVFHMAQDTNKHIHPITVTAVFNLITTILESDDSWFPMRYGGVAEPKYKADYQKEVAGMLQGVVPLLDFLNEKNAKYSSMCIQAGAGAVIDNRRLELKRLTNENMHDMLASVIRVLTYFCREGAKKHGQGVQDVCENVARDLNDNNREEFLFACLVVPSDSVQNAVVDCLCEVPLSELDGDEIAQLVNMLNEVTNISAGETELVLGKSFRLLTKLALDPINGDSFRSTRAEAAINAALSILQRNSERDTRESDKEDGEKYALSASIVRYLEACSAWPDKDESSHNIRAHLRNREVMNLMTNIVKNEDKLNNQYMLRPSHYGEKDWAMYKPVPIEGTWAGRQVDYLLQPFQGSTHLSPVGVVAPRVLRRMADVLMDVPDTNLELMQELYIPNSVGHSVETKGAGDGGGDDDDDEEGGETKGDDDDDAGPAASASWTAYRDNAFEAMSAVKQNAMGLEDLDGGARSFRVAAQLAYSDLGMEQQMPAFWIYKPEYISLMRGTAMSGAVHAVDERLQQHMVFSHFLGLQHLLYFMALPPSLEEKDALDGEIVAPSRLLEDLQDAMEELSDKLVAEEKARELEALHSSVQSGTQLGAETPKGGREILLRHIMLELAPEDRRKNTRGGGGEEKTSVSAALAASGQEGDRANMLGSCLRVIMALLRYGSMETVASVKGILRDPEKFRLLLNACSGPPTAPYWFDFNVGAKLMCVVSEVLQMDWCARRDPQDTFMLYDNAASVIYQIMMALNGRLDQKSSLNVEESVLALHAAQAAATIARQLPHVNLTLPATAQRLAGGRSGRTGSGDESPREVLMKQVLTYLYEQIFPLQLLKVFIRLTLHDTFQKTGAQRNTNSKKEDYGHAWELNHPADLLREAVSNVISMTLLHSERCRFEIMEHFSLMEMEHDLMIRQSLLQDILSLVSNRMYVHALQGYMHRKKMTMAQENPEEEDVPERIIEASWVQQITNMSKNSRRLLVLTNVQLYILKEPFMLFGKPKDSPPHKFHPDGPARERVIKYTDIVRVLRGYGGQRLHFVVDETKRRNKPSEPMTFVCTQIATCKSLYSSLMHMCHHTAEAQQSQVCYAVHTRSLQL